MRPRTSLEVVWGIFGMTLVSRSSPLWGWMTSVMERTLASIQLDSTRVRVRVRSIRVYFGIFMAMQASRAAGRSAESSARKLVNNYLSIVMMLRVLLKEFQKKNIIRFARKHQVKRYAIKSIMLMEKNLIQFMVIQLKPSKQTILSL